MERMIKFYCDRCKKETEKLVEIKIPTVKNNYGSFDTKPCQVCVGCQREYNDIICKLTDIRFVLFDGFMRKEDEGK